MSTCFVYAASASEAGAFAKQQGWRPAGRAGWQTRDGILVLFICFLEQLDVVIDRGAIVYDAGLCAEARKRLRKRRITVRPRRFQGSDVPPATTDEVPQIATYKDGL